MLVSGVSSPTFTFLTPVNSDIFPDFCCWIAWTWRDIFGMIFLLPSVSFSMITTTFIALSFTIPVIVVIAVVLLVRRGFCIDENGIGFGPLPCATFAQFLKIVFSYFCDVNNPVSAAGFYF